MSRSALLITAAAALTAALVFAPLSAGSGATSSKSFTVSIRDNSFRPKSLTVHSGARVVWRWKGSFDHNVRFRKVPSGASKRGSSTKSSGTFVRTFKQRGTYSYVCTIHQALGMKGTVHVE